MGGVAGVGVVSAGSSPLSEVRPWRVRPGRLRFRGKDKTAIGAPKKLCPAQGRIQGLQLEGLIWLECGVPWWESESVNARRSSLRSTGAGPPSVRENLGRRYGLNKTHHD